VRVPISKFVRKAAILAELQAIDARPCRPFMFLKLALNQPGFNLLDGEPTPNRCYWLTVQHLDEGCGVAVVVSASWGIVLFCSDRT